MSTRALDNWRCGGPGDRAGDVAVRALRDRLEAVGEALDRTVEAVEDAETVHALRVAARRAAAAVSVFAEWIPKRRSQRWETRLDRIRKVAGTARNADVMAKRLEETGIREVLEDLRRERKKARKPILRMARRAQKREWFGSDLKKLLSRVERRVEWQDARFDVWAVSRLQSIVRRFLRAAPIDSDSEKLHRFRIRAKELRYALELLCGALPPSDADAAYEAVETVQKDLGEINDTATRIADLRDRLRKTEDADVFDQLRTTIADAEAKRERDQTEFLKSWAAGRGEELTQRLEKLLAPEPQFAGIG